MSRRLVDGKMPEKGPDANKGGRPAIIDIDKDIIERIAAVIRMGQFVTTACQINGISYDTLRRWVNLGRENPDTLYGELFRVVTKAIAEADVRDLSVIDAHGTGRPTEYLMRPVKDAFGQVQMDGNGKPIMEPVTDANGMPIKVREEIKSNWQAAAWKLERRAFSKWGRWDGEQVDDPLKIEAQNPKEQEKEVISPEQYNSRLKEYKETATKLIELEDDEWSK